MIVKKVNSSEQWYQAQQKLKNGALATGFGTTPTRAVDDCFRDLAVITKLKKEVKTK